MPAPKPTVGTLAIDTSALLCRYLGDHRRDLVEETMSQAQRHVVSALAQTEVRLALQSVAANPSQYAALWREAGFDWDGFWEVPLDGRCLALASEIGTRYGLGLVNAMHLAAFDRLPRPATLLTFDRAQIAAATAMGFEVYTASETPRGAAGLLADS